MKSVSIVLAIAAGGYFAVHAYRSLSGHNLAALIDGSAIIALCVLTLVYAGSIATTAAAWSRQLRDMRQPHDFRRFIAILASTQFGKYLPGNVGQHVGRVALAKRAGVDMAAATLSVLYELLLALTASAHITAIALVLAPPEFVKSSTLFAYRWPLLFVISGGAVAGLVLIPGVASRLIRRRNPRSGPAQDASRLRLDASIILFSYLMYATGVVAIGCALWGAAHAIGDTAAVPGPLFFVGAFAGSWILGFIAPGAPAGLGVREAVLSAWLSQSLSPAAVVVLVILLRIATTTGDLLNFVWGSAMVMRQGRVGA